MLVAITGGCGFIGRRLVEKHIRRGDDVRVLSRRNLFPVEGVDVFVVDLCDFGSNLEAFADGADVLYHCAGEIHDESLMYELHVEGTRRLQEVAEGHIGR